MYMIYVYIYIYIVFATGKYNTAADLFSKVDTIDKFVSSQRYSRFVKYVKYMVAFTHRMS